MDRSITTRPLALVPTGRRIWVEPRLERHASMTVLTQSVLGSVEVLLLQAGISCTFTSGCDSGTGAARAPGSPQQLNGNSQPIH